MSWNVSVIIVTFLVFSGRAFVIIEWCFLGCLSAGIALCVGWLVIGRSLDVSVKCRIFFF